MGIVPITGSVLKWAREESGYSLEEACEHVDVSATTFSEWESDDLRPNKTQIRKLAKLFRRQYTVFLLPEPPENRCPAHLRHSPGLGGRELTPDELYALRKYGRLKEIASVILEDLIGTGFDTSLYLSETDTPEVSARMFRSKLGVSIVEQKCAESDETAFLLWRNAFEKLGVLVFSVPIQPGGIRSFCLRDSIVPLICLNSYYPMRTQIFGMAHAAGHILRGQDVSCQEYAFTSSEASLEDERWCDEFASELLMPVSDVTRVVSEKYGNGSETSAVDIVQHISDLFNTPSLPSGFKYGQLAMSELGFDLSAFKISDNLERHRSKRRHGSNSEHRLLELGSLTVAAMMCGYANKDIGLIDMGDYLDLKWDGIKELETWHKKRLDEIEMITSEL